jgi:hypothetical protein
MIIRKLKIDDMLIGSAVPKQASGNGSHGNIGEYIENILNSNGYPVNKGAGCDINISGVAVEVKTRNIDSDAPHTVGSMTYEEICNTPYVQSNICKKFQQQYRVYFKDGEPGHIVKARVCNFTDECIQSQIKKSYEEARKILVDNPMYAKSEPWTTVKGFTNCPAYFEKTKTGSSWAFRITDLAMRGYESIDSNRQFVNDIFN